MQWANRKMASALKQAHSMEKGEKNLESSKDVPSSHDFINYHM